MNEVRFRPPVPRTEQYPGRPGGSGFYAAEEEFHETAQKNQPATAQEYQPKRQKKSSPKLCHKAPAPLYFYGNQYQ